MTKKGSIGKRPTLRISLVLLCRALNGHYSREWSECIPMNGVDEWSICPWLPSAYMNGEDEPSCCGKTREWRGNQWTIPSPFAGERRKPWMVATKVVCVCVCVCVRAMCFLTVSSRPCLETSPHSILRTPFAGHCVGALWGCEPCPAELSEGVNRVLRALSGDPPLPILSRHHLPDTV